MFLNDRMMPPELLYYKALEKRSVLNQKDKIKLKILERGYEGECLYDEIFDQVGHEHVYIFRDVYLKIENSITQYDSIIISNNNVVVNEIKNYSGDYRYENGQWFNGSRQLSDDGISQVARAVNKLVKLGDTAGITIEATGKVIFPNDDFRLISDEDGIWRKIVVRSELKKYLRQFRNESLGGRAQHIAGVIQDSISENPYFKNQADMRKLRKGLYCGKCGNFNMIKSRYHRKCSSCGMKESNETHMLRVMSDHKFLFYGSAMTRNSVLELVGDEFDKKVLYRSFLKYCDSEKRGKKTGYIFKYYDFDDAFKKTKDFMRHKNYIG